MFIDEGIAGRPNRARMVNPEFKKVGIISCPQNLNSLTVIDYAGTIEPNDNTREAIENQSQTAPAPKPIVNEKLPEIRRCTQLPTSVVSRDTCGFFDIVN